jgi:YD repeat-containing protein
MSDIKPPGLYGNKNTTIRSKWQGLLKHKNPDKKNYAQYWDATAQYSSITSPITKAQVKGLNV